MAIAMTAFVGYERTRTTPVIMPQWKSADMRHLISSPEYFGIPITGTRADFHNWWHINMRHHWVQARWLYWNNRAFAEFMAN